MKYCSGIQLQIKSSEHGTYEHMGHALTVESSSHGVIRCSDAVR